MHARNQKAQRGVQDAKLISIVVKNVKEKIGNGMNQFVLICKNTENE